MKLQKNVQNGNKSKWHQMVQNCSKWHQITQNGQNQNGTKLYQFQMALNCTEWYNILHRAAPIGTKCHQIQTAPNQNDTKRHHMAPN